jgi:sulfite reductase (ferredoxin)
VSTDTEPGPRDGRTAGRSRPARSEGQWALGDREPLNPNETWKATEGGLAVRARVEETYAREGFASIDPVDRNGRLRWWGLYTQRKPGIDGGRTAALEPHELDDEYFMLRVRIDGGAVNLAQLRVLAEISTEYARGTADITDRQNIQYHWIRIEDAPAIWAKLEAVGLRTTEACGDTPRVILGSPVAGVAADEILDGTPAIAEIQRRYVGDPALANLPRKFKTAISGSPHQDVAHEIHDVASSGSTTPSTARASTCGWAGACRPIRCSPSASTRSYRSRTSPRSGSASSGSSATTGTGGCATGHA